MKKGKGGAGLLSIALCVLVAGLIVKLAITVVGVLSPREDLAAVPEVMAVEEKPKVDAQKSASANKAEPSAPAPVERLSKNKQAANAASESITALQQKEQEIRRREELVREKEEQLARLEKEIEQKVKDLLAMQKEIQVARNEKQDAQNTKVRSLSKIYGTMKPKEAAKLMENLDDRLVMGIISTMTPDEAAAILSLMEVKKAAKISEALSGKLN